MEQTRDQTQEIQYDYDNQAWIVGGLYVDCGHRMLTHTDKLTCMTLQGELWQESELCFGRVHQGQRAPSIH